MLGDISGKYESGNRADAVSTGAGDLGGVSYGAHQFIAPVADSFVKWLKANGHPAGDMLGSLKAGTQRFSEMWKHAARTDSGFLSLQHEYTKMMYYDPAVKLLAEANYHAEKHSDAVKEMIFSRAVQYGAKWMPELFLKGMRLKNPKYLNLSYIDAEKFDSELIFGVYDFLIGCCAQASYSSQKGIYHDPEEWTCGSFDVVKNGLKNRFVREKADLLSMLGGEGD